MGISNYKELNPSKQHKFNTLYRSSKYKMMEEQEVTKNYYTTHGAYGQPLPQRKDKKNDENAK